MKREKGNLHHQFTMLRNPDVNSMLRTTRRHRFLIRFSHESVQQVLIIVKALRRTRVWWDMRNSVPNMEVIRKERSGAF